MIVIFEVNYFKQLIIINLSNEPLHYLGEPLHIYTSILHPVTLTCLQLTPRVDNLIDLLDNETPLSILDNPSVAGSIHGLVSLPGDLA